MLIEQLLLTAVVIGCFVTLLFVVSLIIKRNDIADVAWGIGIFTVALVSYFSGPQTIPTQIMTVLAGLWGLRLTVRIFLRNLKKPEDYRYKVWRDSWGSWFFIRSYFQVYLLQGFLMIVVGYPFIHASVYGGALTTNLFFILGILVWLIGYLFEAIGDWQLDRFIKSRPEPGTVLSSGLWKYTRHPNYFGEVTMWWGIWFMILTLPMSYIALVSPLMITFLILIVSGIPMLEKSLRAMCNSRYKTAPVLFSRYHQKLVSMKKIIV